MDINHEYVPSMSALHSGMAEALSGVTSSDSILLNINTFVTFVRLIENNEKPSIQFETSLAETLIKVAPAGGVAKMVESKFAGRTLTLTLPEPYADSHEVAVKRQRDKRVHDEKIKPEPYLKIGRALQFPHRHEPYPGRLASRCTDYIRSARPDGVLKSKEGPELPPPR
ncbi:MAG: hypothetical protein ACMX3H_08050 [Sodalis sp. (in: enterobacteria)]|uniref:hypothetical protein n=1 Tax=Sodalis sp. (in: enterobacteria) TaxID=1898979 RepID=UPI0039E29F15